MAVAAGNGATVAIELDVAVSAFTGSMRALVAADSNAPLEIYYLTHAGIGIKRLACADALSGDSSYC